MAEWQCPFLWRSLKDKVYRSSFTAGDVYILLQSPVGLMPSGNGVLTWRKFGQLEFPVLPGDRKVGSPENDKISLHPGVNVALYGDNLFFVIRVGEGRRTFRLDPVPFPVDLRQRVDVVPKRIAVRDTDVLPYAKCKNMRGVAAILLVNDAGRQTRIHEISFPAGLERF